jgi:sodium-dependent dicarboxylate transporter 2/3/5
MQITKQQIGFILGLLVFVLVAFFSNLDPNNPKISYTLATALLMAIWWVMEVFPMAVTALLPVVLFPFLGVENGKLVASAYFNDIIFLFIGGFMIALAMQKWNLHKRIAISILRFTGVGLGQIVAGFMIATAFLSMWISNTATAMMMVPIAMSILSELENHIDQKDIKKYNISLLLAIAYSASIGGVATLVGTPPNLAFVKILNLSFPNAPEISFGEWMFFALPLSIILLLILWLFLYLVFFRKIKNIDDSGIKAILEEERAKNGKISVEEKIVSVAFVLFAVLLVFRKDLDLGLFIIPGWSNILKTPSFINDGVIAISIGILLFLIPAKSKVAKSILDWETMKDMPWGIVLLFGGGFALAKGFVSSGLSLWIGNELGAFFFENQLLNILIVSGLIIFLTEITSNIATTQIMLPVLGGIAISVGQNPLLLMIPATIAASMAFMLPVATAPNAIVFGSGKIKIAEMARVGFFLNLITLLIIVLYIWFLGLDDFDIQVGQLPLWAI